MSLKEKLTKKVAEDIGIDIKELGKEALIAFLRERRRKIMLEMLEIFRKYNVNSSEELHEKVKSGEALEHPGWEDLILLENLEASLEIVEEDIRAIQESS